MMEVCALVEALRRDLEDAGYKWRDASERFIAGSSLMEFQRTKVIDENGEQIASCVWILSINNGMTTGHSYGWPDQIECWIKGSQPEAMTIDEIIGRLGALND